MTTAMGAAAFAIQDIALVGYGADDYEGSDLGAMLDAAVQSGANYVTLGNSQQMDLSSGALVDNPTLTTDFSDMGPAILAAEARGLQVMLLPQVGDATGQSFSQPGEVLSDPPAFFASYKKYLLQWAALAQQDHVAILSIGSEMTAATGPQYTAYWDDIIASVRGVYSGKLTYYALTSEVSQVQFWSKLDYVGLDIFPDLTSAADPGIADLDAAWGPTVSAVTKAVGGLGLPVLFTSTGVASIDGGAAGTVTDPEISQPGTVTNLHLQENWWQSFFETWGTDKSSWLDGIAVWNDDPSAIGGYSFYQQGYSVYGKPAAAVIASWFGADQYLQPLQSSFTGSVANDRIHLYGAQAQGTPANQDASFDTDIAITLQGTVTGGQAPVVDIIVNGKDMGLHALSAAQTELYEGLTYTANQTFTVSLGGLRKIADLRVVLESADAQTYISSVDVDGVALTSSVYYPATGGLQAQSIGSSASQWAQGFSVIDASAWNDAITRGHPGTAALPIAVDGNGGTDIVDLLGQPGQYAISGYGTGTVTVRENSGLDQNADLSGISELDFADGTVIDLSTGQWTVDTTAATVAANISDYASLIAGGHISAVAVTDSMADVVANLASLQALAAGGELGGINLTDSGFITLPVTPAQSKADGAAIAHIANNFIVSILPDAFSEIIAGVPGVANQVSFSGAAASYSITPAGDGKSFTIGNGVISDSVSGVTALQFSDGTEFVASLTPAVAGGVSSAQVTNLYSAVLARMPDVAGLAYYEAVAVANPSIPITAYAEWFLQSPEYTADSAHAYAQTPAGDAQFITDTYFNLLRRAPETGAVAWYQANVVDPLLSGLTAGTAAYSQAELLAHARVLAYFSQSAEFLGDVQITAAHPADAQRWLVLI